MPAWVARGGVQGWPPRWPWAWLYLGGCLQHVVHACGYAAVCSCNQRAWVHMHGRMWMCKVRQGAGVVMDMG